MASESAFRKGTEMLARFKRALLPIGIGLAGVVVFYALQVTKPRPAPRVEAARAISVEVVPAIRAISRPTVVAYGEVRPGVRTRLVAQVSGRVTSVAPEFIEGGEFSPGEVLLTIEDTDYRAMVSERKARLAAAEVDLQQALADADVAQRQLASQKNPSPLALKKPQVARAESAVKAADTALALAMTNLARTRVSLPFIGRVETQAADLGQYVNLGTVLGSVFGTSLAEVRVALTDSQLSALGIPIGFNADAEEEGLPTVLSAFMGGKMHRWGGRLTRLDASIDPTTRTVYGTVVVEDPYGERNRITGMPLVMGLYVDVEIQGKLIVDAIQIPEDSLRVGNEIFVLDGEGLLDIRKAEVAHRNRNIVLLKSGVEPGELVIISAIRNPIRGMRLKAIDSAGIAETQPALSSEV